MPKKIMEDLKPKGVRITKISKESSSNVIPNEKSQTTPDNISKIENKPASSNHILTREQKQKIFSTPQKKKSSTYVRKPIKIFFILSVFVGILYLIATTFENTHIVINEKKMTFTLNKEQFNAFSTEDAPVNFELMIMPESESKEIILTDPQDVSIKAHGEVVFYNEYTTKPQKLLVHTFISDNTGKSYQTDSPITIPGYKLDPSKKIIPGSTSVGITSFLPGDSYNGSPSDFSVNLFKGTPKAKKIYAKLKSPLTGGAQGMVYKPSLQDMGILNAYAASTFKSNLIKKVNAQVPSGYILYPNAMTITSSVEDNILSSTPKYKAKISGVVSAVLLKEKDLSNNIVKKLLPDLPEKEVREVEIGDISHLVFDFANQSQSITKDLKSIAFTLSGTINPIWHHDTESLKKSLAGVAKSEIQSIFKLDPGITSASVKIFPPWNKYLPNDQSKINIKLQ